MTLTDAKLDGIDCGDNSCRFVDPFPRGGMRTNGGCRCLGNAGYPRSTVAALPLMLKDVLTLRTAVRDLAGALKESILSDSPYTMSESKRTLDRHAALIKGLRGE